MARVARSGRHKSRVLGQYRRLLVSFDGSPQSIRALEIACRLATDEHATIRCVFVLEVPASLPLDAHMIEAEDAALRLLERAGATGDAYGIRVVPKLVRARDTAAAIVDEAIAGRVEIVLIGAMDGELAYPRSRFAAAVRSVLASAPCRVMVVSEPAREPAERPHPVEAA